MKKIGWRFGSLDYGRKEGLNDSSVSFKGSQLFSSLPKEIIQNSIDARDDKTKPVVVKFEMQQWKREEIPGLVELEKIFDSCKQSWDAQTIRQFFENAQQILKQKTIPVLKASDYNTTGLIGSDDVRQQSPWYSLVKATGVSNKNAGSGGSYGVGKTAPIINSDFRTLIYHTLDKNGLEAAQGVASLVSHETTEPKKTNQDSFTQNVGYFGYKARSAHVEKGSLISPKLVRKETGTDVYVLAYKEHKDWKIRMIKAVMDIFFVAILEDILVVEIDDIVIDKTTIGILVEALHTGKKRDYLADFYRVYTTKEDDENKFVIPLEIEVRGRSFTGISLHLLISEGLKKRICKMRSNRMLIRHDGHDFIRDYGAILICHGEEINNELKLLESPQHDKWDVNMNENDKAFAKELLRELNKAYKTAIREKMNVDTQDAVQLESLNEILPSNLFDFEHKNRAYEKPSVGETKITAKRIALGVGASTDGEQGKRKGTFSPRRDKKNILHSSRFATMIDRKKGEYLIKITPAQTKAGYITVYQVGEDMFDPVPLEYAKQNGFHLPLPYEKVGKIGPMLFREGREEVFQIQLKDNVRCALEVRLNED